MELSPPARGTALDRLEPRLSRRAEPRLTIALAAAGCALVVVGALLVGGDRLGDGDDGGSQLPGLALSLATAVAGFVALARHRTGPVATAGSVASTLAVPPTMFFLTFDEGSLPPYSTDGILVVSTAVWAGSWLVGPGRGRPLSLGAAAFGLWATALQLVEGVFDVPFALTIAFTPVEPTDGPAGFGLGRGFPDPTTVGMLSLGFAIAYLVVVRSWDRRGRPGAATALVAPALAALAVGIAFLTDELETSGTGLLAVAAGTAVAALGASLARRATTWLGAAGAAFGVVLVVGEIAEEPTPGGFLLVAAGIAVVVGAEALRRATAEEDELSAREAQT